MMIMSGGCGTYMSFSNADEVENLILNLQVMLETNELPLVYGWRTLNANKKVFDQEYKSVKTMRARAGG